MKKYKKARSVESYKERIGKLWRTCLERTPGAGMGDRLAGYKEGVMAEESSPMLTP